MRGASAAAKASMSEGAPTAAGGDGPHSYFPSRGRRFESGLPLHSDDGQELTSGDRAGGSPTAYRAPTALAYHSNMATYVGCLEADLQAASEYTTGGVGPFFRHTRREEPLELLEFLTRATAALRKLGIATALTLFVDEEEIYTADDDATGDTLEAALNATQSAELDGAVGFYLMLSYQDKDFSHIFSVEASVDHPADEAALTILDVATPLEDEGSVVGDAEDSAEEDEEVLEPGDEEPLAPVDDDVSAEYDENMDRIDLIEGFLGRVLAELNKELALTEPEIDVWIDWEGAYTGLGYSSALPGVPGL